MKWLHNHMAAILAIALAAALVYSGNAAVSHNATILDVAVFLSAAALLIGYGVILVLHTGWGRLAAIAGGALVFMVGYRLQNYRSDVVSHYNDAIAQITQGDATNSLKELDAVVACYRAELQRERLPALVLPAPRRDLAALAMFHKGNLLVMMKKTQEASEAYQEGLRLNPADTPQTPPLLQKIALDTRYNLELLLRSGQAHGQGQGNGKGQGQGNKPGDGQQPADQPSAGHSNDEDI